MEVSRTNQRLAYLCALGFILIFTGWGMAYIESHWTLPALSLLLLGSLLVAAGGYRSLGRTKSVTLPGGLRKVGWSVLVCGLVGLFYLLLNYLAYVYNVRADLTKFKQHTLTPATVELLTGLKQDVRLTVMQSGLPPKYLEDLLAEYQRYAGDKVTTTVIDPLVDLSAAAQFGNVINSSEKKLVAESKTERRDIDFSEKPLTEEQVNKAIVSVTRPSRQAYFLTGHGEPDIYAAGDEGYNKLTKLLLSNNVIPKTLMLGIEKAIPADCDVLVVAGPKTPLSEDEEKLIVSYLKQGGDALFLIEDTKVTNPDKPLTEEELKLHPALNGILSQWGVIVNDDIAVDLTSNVGDVGSPATRSYMRHKSIVSGLDYTFFIRPRSISLSPNRRETIKLAPLILTASPQNKSFGETNRTLQVKYDEGIDRPGPVSIAYVIFEPKDPALPDAAGGTRLIVLTDADFLTNRFIGQYSNAALGINTISWLSDLDEKPINQVKDVDVVRVDLTSRDQRVVTAVLWFMPFLVVLQGMLVWIKRESK